MVLQPNVTSAFEAKFSGLDTAVQQVSDLNYSVATPNCRKATRVCHVNLLKPYYSHQTEGKRVNGSCTISESAYAPGVALASSPAASLKESITPEIIL